MVPFHHLIRSHLSVAARCGHSKGPFPPSLPAAHTNSHHLRMPTILRSPQPSFRTLMPAIAHWNEACDTKHNWVVDNCPDFEGMKITCVAKWVPWRTISLGTSQETERSLRKFLEPSEKPEVIYTDNSLEFGTACEELSWNHLYINASPFRSSGIAE